MRVHRCARTPPGHTVRRARVGGETGAPPALPSKTPSATKSRHGTRSRAPSAGRRRRNSRDRLVDIGIAAPAAGLGPATAFLPRDCRRPRTFRELPRNDRAARLASNDATKRLPARARAATNSTPRPLKPGQAGDVQQHPAAAARLPDGQVHQHVDREREDQPDGDHHQFQRQRPAAIAVHDTAFSARDNPRYCPVEATDTMIVNTTASAMLYPNSPSVKASL